LSAPREISILNASINHFQSDGESIELVLWGDIGHLEKNSMDEIELSILCQAISHLRCSNKFKRSRVKK